MTRRPQLSARELREQNPPRRMVGRRQAAVYCDVSERLFTRLVKLGRLPAPRLVTTGKATLEKWDIRELDAALDHLPRGGDAAGVPGAQPRRLFNF